MLLSSGEELGGHSNGFCLDPAADSRKGIDHLVWAKEKPRLSAGLKERVPEVG
jgi:hypothetical protein